MSFGFSLSAIVGARKRDAQNVKLAQLKKEGVEVEVVVRRRGELSSHGHASLTKQTSDDGQKKKKKKSYLSFSPPQ